MKLGIRSKLLLAFLAVTILPIVLTLILFGVASFKLDNDPELQQYSQTDLIFSDISENVVLNFEKINTYDSFHKEIEPILKKFSAKLQIVSVDSIILFDSDNKALSGAISDIPISFSYGFDKRYQKPNPGKSSYVMPLVVNKRLEGNMIIIFKDQALINGGLGKILFYYLMSIVAGIAILILLAAILTRLLSRSVLIPLKELNAATQKISEGNLDFDIAYKNNDELGRFCQAFNTMKDRLKESLEKQQKEENGRKELIASISHDLRTPISSIKGYVEALQDGMAKDPETFERYLSVIGSKTTSLDRLIDDLFQFTQLELGRLEMHMEWHDSRELLECILNQIEIEPVKSSVAVNIQRPFPSVIINSDKDRINQVIDNLIQNARKFSPENSIVRVGAAVKDAFLEVWVKDNGIGISTEDLSHIFERFYRGEKSRSREYGGTGLGLAICKYIVEQHGGKIWASSILGKGSTFIFSIPVVNMPSTTQAPTSFF